MPDVYQQMKHMWEDIQFRQYVSKRHREANMKRIEDEMLKLEQEYTQLQNSTEVLSKNIGSSAKKLKDALQWSNEDAHQIIKEFKKQHPEKRYGIAKQLSSLLDSLFA
jgi:seryl-tRNA synthetase